MKRRKAVPHPNLRGLKKTRDGCLTCRKRRKKCDCRQPVCAACERLGLRCSFATMLSWRRVHQTTLSPKQSAQLRKSWAQRDVKKDYPLHLINYTCSEISLTYDSGNGLEVLANARTDQERRCELLLPPMDVVLSHMKTDPVNEHSLFQHFQGILARNKTFGECDEIPNEFRELVVPRCSRFPALYQVALALAALDLMKLEILSPEVSRNRSTIDTYYSLYVRYVNSSISILYELLDDYEAAKEQTLEEVVTTLVLLFSAEITNRGNMNWVRHLQEAAIIFSALSEEQIQTSRTFQFAYRYFSLRFILVLATLKGTMRDQFIVETSWRILPSFFESSNHIEPMFGCPPRLLYLIHEMTMMEDKHLSSSKWSQLSTFDWVANDRSRADALAVCSHCYLLTAKIYYCHLLRRRDSEVFEESEYLEIYDSLVPQLLDALSEYAIIKGSMFFPNWSLLVLANCTSRKFDQESFRVKILRLFDLLENTNPLSSMAAVKKAVEAVWKLADLRADENTGGDFDWRDALAKYGFVLALT